MESEALIEFGKPLERIKTETPSPQGKEVLLKVTYGGVCHSDVHIQDGLSLIHISEPTRP